MIDKAMAVAISKNMELDLGMYKDFEKSLNNMFVPYDAPGDALEKMKELRIKIEDSIDNHVAKFKMLVSESGLGTTSAAVTDLFCETLPIPLQQQISSSRNHRRLSKIGTNRRLLTILGKGCKRSLEE